MMPVLLTLAYIIKFSFVHCAFITEALLDKDPLAQQLKDQVDFADLCLARRIQPQVGKVIVAQQPHDSQTVGLGVYLRVRLEVVSHLVLAHVWVALVQRPQHIFSLLLLLEQLLVWPFGAAIVVCSRFRAIEGLSKELSVCSGQCLLDLIVVEVFRPLKDLFVAGVQLRDRVNMVVIYVIIFDP